MSFFKKLLGRSQEAAPAAGDGLQAPGGDPEPLDRAFVKSWSTSGDADAPPIDPQDTALANNPPDAAPAIPEYDKVWEDGALEDEPVSAPGGLAATPTTAEYGDAGEQTYLAVELENTQDNPPGALASGPGDEAPAGDPSARAFPTETIAPGDAAFPTETIAPGDEPSAGDDRPTEEIAFYYNKVGAPPDDAPGDLASGPGDESPTAGAGPHVRVFDGGSIPADGETDARDFLVWQRNLGTTAGEPVGNAASGPGDEAGDPLANFEIQTPDPGEDGDPLANFEIQTPGPDDGASPGPFGGFQGGVRVASGDVTGAPGPTPGLAGQPPAPDDDGPSVLFDQGAPPGDALDPQQVATFDLDPDMPDPSGDDLPDV